MATIDILNAIEGKIEDVPVIHAELANPTYQGPQGPQGERGPQGEQGPKGEQGSTPVRGVDYWTEEDKAEIIAAIPIKDIEIIDLGTGLVHQQQMSQTVKNKIKTAIQYLQDGKELFKHFLVKINGEFCLGITEDNNYFYFTFFYKSSTIYKLQSLRVQADTSDENIYLTSYSVSGNLVYLTAYQSPSGIASDLVAALTFLNENKAEKTALNDYATVEYVDSAVANSGGGSSVAIDGTTIIQNPNGTISTAIGGSKAEGQPATTVFSYEDATGVYADTITVSNFRVQGLSEPDLPTTDPGLKYTLNVEFRKTSDNTIHSGSGLATWYWPNRFTVDSPFLIDDSLWVNYIDYSSGTLNLSTSRVNSEITYQSYYLTKVEFIRPKTYVYSPIDANFIKIGESLKVDSNQALQTTLKGLEMRDGRGLIGDSNHIDAGYSPSWNVALGYQNYCGNQGSVALGYQNTAISVGGFAAGYKNKAQGQTGTMAIGRETIASASTSQFVCGLFNLEDSQRTYPIIIGNGTHTSARANGLTIDTAGNVAIQGTLSSSGADYAEYFEWADGNPLNEDRVGLLVCLEGNKIRLAQTYDDDILGIVSGTAMVLGDDAEWVWQGKYVKDNFGRIQMESVETFDEDGNSLGYILTPKINPAFNQEEIYISRAKRKEWSTIGLMGKLCLRDDGTCQVNGYATPGTNGIASSSTGKTNMRVMERITENIVRVCLK